MIGNLSDRKFRVYDSGVNLRKSFSGLFGIIEKENQSVEFFNNTAFVFINNRRNMFKCLYWENDGLAIWNKRLTKGTFALMGDREDILSFSDFILFIHGYIPPENREEKKAKKM